MQLKCLINFFKVTLAISLCPLLGLLTGCGLFGTKDSKNKTTSLNQNSGCLDRLGPLFNAYLKGDVNPTEWTNSWECVDTTLETFTQYVVGSEKNAYTQDDVKLLVGRFILTSKPITPEFISSLFSLKSTLFGGDDRLLTKEEIKKFRTFATYLKTRSLSLIPKIWNMHNDKTRKNLDDFSSDLQGFTNEASAFLYSNLKIESNLPFSKSQLTLFITELGKNSMDFNPDEIQDWVGIFFEVKTLFFRGNKESLLPSDFLSLLKMAGDLGGKYFSLSSDQPSLDTSPKLNLIASAQSYFRSSFILWNGKIPFTFLEAMIDLIPNRLLPIRADDFKDGLLRLLRPRFETVDEKIIKVPSAISVLLKNKSPEKDGFIFYENISDLLSEFSTLVKMDRTLNQVYEGEKGELDNASFEAKLKQLSRDGKLDFNIPIENERLIQNAKNQKGMLNEGSSMMRFTGVYTHSKTNLSSILWIERGAKRLLETYGYRKDEKGNPFANLEDLNHLVKDINPLLNAFSMIHPDAVDIYKKRFREVNIFMFNSNGDSEADLNEVTEYISVLISGGNQSSQIAKAIFDVNEDGTKPCKKIGWDDKVQLPTYDTECFRKEFSSNFESFYKNYPDLLSTLRITTSENRESFFKKIEAAARFSGYSNTPIADFDMASYAGIAHYVEIVMHRFDDDGGKPDGFINRREALRKVFPVFENELKGLTKIKIKFVNQAILLYLLQYGHSPFKCNSKPSKKEITSLLGWLITGGPFKSIAASRLRIYEVFGELSASGGACVSTSDVATFDQNEETASLNEILDQFPSDLKESL